MMSTLKDAFTSCFKRRPTSSLALVNLLKSTGFPESQITSYDRRAPVYNIRIPVKPGVIVSPRTAQEVALAVSAARKAGVHVKAVCGSHSFANLGYGADGSLVINMKHFQRFEIDKTTWNATIGGGTLLGDVTKRLHVNGKRAISHGTCPQVGVGGHATIGGLGPTSRQWGTTLDHVIEVEAVTANGDIVRASAEQNSDLFWAIRGAGGSFAVVTEFVFKTHPEPGLAVQYRFEVDLGYPKVRETFKRWQAFIAQPGLDRKFASLVIISNGVGVITGTYYGTMEEYDAFGFEKIFGDEGIKKSSFVTNWIGDLQHWAEAELLEAFGGLPMSFYAKSLTVPDGKPLPDNVVDSMFDYVEKADKGTLAWAIIADFQSGATNDVPLEATAYAHRDTLWMLQSYAIDLNPFDGGFSPKMTQFLNGLNDLILKEAPYLDRHGSGALYYPGYVDLAVDKKRYWGSNYTRLLEVKQKWDPDNVFADLQSVGKGLEK